jgi:hypothetical protein
MSDKHRYVVDALLADLTSRHHHVRAASEEEAERRTRERYPGAVAVLARREDSRQRVSARFGPLP